MAPNNSEAKDGQMDAATTRGIPQLKNIEQVSEGWINKYILTYELPDGTDYVYESTSRKKLESYRTGLLANAAARRRALTPFASWAKRAKARCS